MITTNHRRTVGLILDALGHEHPRELWRGWLDATAELDANTLGILGGYLPSMCDVEHVEAPDPRNGLHERAASPTLEGLAIRLGSLSRDPDEAAAFCARFADKPVINLGFAVAGLPTVSEDAAAGVKAAVDHLAVVHGRRRFAYVRGPEGNPFAEARYLAFEAALAAANLPQDPRFVTPGGDWGSAYGDQAVEHLLARGAVPDALLAANDKLALGAIAALRRHGLRVPQDVAVVGFDNLEEARSAEPALTTIQFPSYALGRRAAELLWDRLEGRPVPAVTLVASPLVVRRSCGCTGDAAGSEEVKRPSSTQRWAKVVAAVIRDGQAAGHVDLAADDPLHWPLATLSDRLARAGKLLDGTTLWV